MSKISHLRLVILSSSRKVLLVTYIDNGLLTFANFIFSQIQMQLLAQFSLGFLRRTCLPWRCRKIFLNTFQLFHDVPYLLFILLVSILVQLQTFVQLYRRLDVPVSSHLTDRLDLAFLRLEGRLEDMVILY